jgi:hypothetical protein
LAGAFDIAGDDTELVGTIARRLSPLHRKALSEVVQQNASRRPAAFVLSFFDDAGETPLGSHVQDVFNAAVRLPKAKRGAKIAEIAAWLDSTQIERGLECLTENADGWIAALTALLQRSAALCDLELIERIINRVDNKFMRRDLIRDVAEHLPASALPLALAHAEHHDSSIGALAVRAARLGEAEILMSMLDSMTWANNMDAIEQVYRFAQEHLLERLMARAEAARPGERARALAEVVPRIADDRRQALVEKVVRDSFDLRMAQNPKRLRILRTLEAELSTLPTQALAKLWAEAMRDSAKSSREEVMVDVRGFARPLVAHFGPSVSSELDDAIQVGGRDEWP